MKVYDQKLKRNVVIFKEYELNGGLVCPECQRELKESDIKRLKESGKISCIKCGAKLKK